MTLPRIDIADLVRRSQAMAQGAGLGAGLGAGFGSAFGAGRADDAALREVTGFGSDPGRLRMLEFVPDGLPAGAPLVVVLHGCTQTAGGYDRGSGWSALAARRGFALLLPEQRPGNNPNRCFNWFEPAHTRRDRGEAQSIREMVAHAVVRHRLDPRRVFVTGLSAGGAMTSVMLATYPEVFAAGAVIAGLPYDAAHSVAEAFEAMATARPRPAQARGEAVRRASPHRGPWPRVAVWQGGADSTVAPANATEILQQWQDLHGLSGAPQPGRSLGPAHHHRIWRGRDGTPLLEHHTIAGMGHGVPIAPRGGPSPREEALGEAMPFMLDVGIPSTLLIADFFGLGQAPAKPTVKAAGPGRVIGIGRDGIARVAPRPGPATAASATAAPAAAEARPAPPAAAPTAARTPPAAVVPDQPAPVAPSPAPPAPAATEPPPIAPAPVPPAPPQAGPTLTPDAWSEPAAAAPDTHQEPPAEGTPPEPPRRRFDPGRVIRKALRAAGLLDR